MHQRLPRLLVVVVALAACSSEKPSTATKKLHGIPTLTGATRPPGAELGNGFTVAAGAALMADVFPLGADEALANLPATRVFVSDPPTAFASHTRRSRHVPAAGAGWP